MTMTKYVRIYDLPDDRRASQQHAQRIAREALAHPYAALTYIVLAEHGYALVDLQDASAVLPWLTQGQVKWAMAELVETGLAEREIDGKRRASYFLMTEEGLAQ